MITVIGMLLVAVAVGIVGWPLVRKTTANAEPVPVEDYELSDLLFQREATYAAISELDADRQMGNLSDADYTELRQRYEEKAMAILKAMDEIGAPSESVAAYPEATLSDEIESEVLQLRSRGSRRGRKDAGAACWSCGAAVAPNANFCSLCGAALSSVCPACGAQGEPEDRFCARCGATLELSRG